ncbi:1822_t:CDS:2 [Ambispora gerdemannii]|uniref:1822_t:CDS:1 n=1 Tax=Ambispora gerdemannii TaxID=144530 RepID=A0A9N9A1E6_9GLOM|nr:1822_t:CDS:2 [Ambispora gerdemannii]
MPSISKHEAQSMVIKKLSSIISLPRSGRPPILAVEQCHIFDRLLQINNVTTTAEMTEKLKQKDSNLKVFIHTIQRTLKKSLI